MYVTRRRLPGVFDILHCYLALTLFLHATNATKRRFEAQSSRCYAREEQYQTALTRFFEGFRSCTFSAGLLHNHTL